MKSQALVRAPQTLGGGLARSAVLEWESAALARCVADHVRRRRGKYVRGENGSLHVVFGTERVELNLMRDNLALARLLLQGAGIGSLTTVAKLAIQRLQVYADERSTNIRLRRFSALREDRLYVPVADGRLLLVRPESLQLVPNGDNRDGFWVVHPSADALRLPTGGCLPDRSQLCAALSWFERLLVETQACANPAMRWLVAIHLALIPFIRDELLARAILVLRGPSQSGKTSGAQRFTKLLGLGEVKGDYSVAAFGNLQDVGLLAIDNKEQADFDRELTNYCLYLSTGAERGRSDSDGNIRVSGSRPIAVITTIEGVFKDELRRRCVELNYRRTDPRLPRAPIERGIAERRHTVLSGLMHVLARYLAIRHEAPPPLEPLPDFAEYYTAACGLLRAYSDVSGRPRHWAESIIAMWNSELRSPESDEDELEVLLIRAVVQGHSGVSVSEYQWQGQTGKLYVNDASALLIALRQLAGRDATLPRTPSGLLRRIESTTFSTIALIGPSGAQAEQASLTPGYSHSIGIFLPASSFNLTLPSDSAPPQIPAAPRLLDMNLIRAHRYLGEDECYYLWDYKSGVSTNGSTDGRWCPTNSLMFNLKVPPCCRIGDAVRWQCKERALRYAAWALSTTLLREWRESATFVPMPPSCVRGSPDFDPRLEVMLAQVKPSIHDVRVLLQQTRNWPALSKGVPPSERERTLCVDERLANPEPKSIIVFDDVLTTGSHFKAAKNVLRRRFRGARVAGLFLARRALDDDST